MARCLWIGHFLNGIFSLQCLAEEKSQRGGVHRYRMRAELSLSKEVRLISSDLVGSKLVGRTVIMFRESCHDP